MRLWENIQVILTSVLVGAVAGFIVTANQVKGKLKLTDTIVSVVTSSFLGFMIAMGFDGVVGAKTQVFLAAVAGAGGYPFLMFFVRALKLGITEKITTDKDHQSDLLKQEDLKD